MKQFLTVVGSVLVVLTSAAAAQELAVERLAALPSLIGTAPSRPVW